MLVQIIERRLSRHREAFAKSMHRSCKEWYLILAHILTFLICKNTTFFQYSQTIIQKVIFQPIGGVTAEKSQMAILNELAQMTFGWGETVILPHSTRLKEYR